MTTSGDWAASRCRRCRWEPPRCSSSAVTYTLVVPGRPRTIAKVVAVVLVAVFVRAPALPRRRPPVRPVAGGRPRRRGPADRVPVLHAERGLPGRVPAREDRPPRRRRAARRGHPQRRAGPARPDRRRVRPVGLEGSGGSTPLRMRVAGDPDTYLFGKLYAMSHVRSDRWYKLGRTHPLRAARGRGAVPDVRRLVAVRGLRAAPAARRRASRPPRPTASSSSRRSASTCSSPSSSTAPRRSATPRSTTASSTRGSPLIRRLWDAGLAHRDIKPANLMVRDGHVAADRRGVRAGASVAVAAGGRPRQHDARPRGAHRRRPRVPSGRCSSSRPTRSPRRSPPPAASPARRSCAR